MIFAKVWVIGYVEPIALMLRLSHNVKGRGRSYLGHAMV